MQSGGLTVWQTILVASIPAAIALLGVIATVVIGQWRSAKAWKEERDERQKDRQHQAKLDQHRFYRAERIAAYRRLVGSGGDMLIVSALRIMPGAAGVAPSNAEANAAWTAALAEVQLVGAWPVVEMAQTMEAKRKDRLVVEATELWNLKTRAARVTPPEPDRVAVHERLFGENATQLAALVAACRADIEALAGLA